MTRLDGIAPSVPNAINLVSDDQGETALFPFVQKSGQFAAVRLHLVFEGHDGIP